MNDLKLLAVDKSLDSQESVVGRIQMSDPTQLSEFIAVANESKEPNEARANETQQSAPMGRSMWRRFFGWVRPSTGSQAVPVVEERQVELTESVSGVAAEQGAGTEEIPEGNGVKNSWFQRSNPFKRAAEEPVQAEFRFENVRAVCNDLSDTDFIIKT